MQRRILHGPTGVPGIIFRFAPTRRLISRVIGLGLHRVQLATPQTEGISRGIAFAQHSGPEVFHMMEVQDPSPGPDEVPIRVRAVAVYRTLDCSLNEIRAARDGR
jgi:hypothetical protein